MARLGCPPPAMALPVVPNALTATGVLLSVVVPLPSWPTLLEPQARTWPVEVSARLCCPPPAMALTLAPAGRLTWTGVERQEQVPEVVVPLPSWPALLEPQATTWPVEVSARLWPPPPAIALRLSAKGGWVTRTGVLLSVVLPSPSWPEALEPQARTRPAEVNARLWLAPPAIAVTNPPLGRLTWTGVLLLVVVPLPSSPWPL